MCLHCNNKAHHNTQADTFRLMPITSLKQLVLAYTFQVDAAGNGTQAEDLDMRASLISTENYTCWEFSIFSIFYLFLFFAAQERGLEYWAFCKPEADRAIWAFSKYTLLFLFLFQDTPKNQNVYFFINITYVACTLDHDR